MKPLKIDDFRGQQVNLPEGNPWAASFGGFGDVYGFFADR